MKSTDQPQVCCRCRQFKLAHLGKFRRTRAYSRWVWECLVCLDAPVEIRHHRRAPSPPEKLVREALLGCRLKVEAEYRVAGFSFDFAVKSLRLLIEVDSVSWHTTQFRKNRDRRKDAAAVANHWKVVRVRGEDVAGQAILAVTARQAELG